MIDTNLADLRKTYSKMELTERSVSADPFQQFGKWMNEALGADVPEPTAMTLGTASGEGRPSSRVVLLKGFDQSGFVFYTNYKSRKGRDLAENPYAAMHFFWPELERQIDISGKVELASAKESDEYFASRPFDSRIGAWASRQSEKIASRSVLVKRVLKIVALHPTGHVPRPEHWGGFRLIPDRIEFWQGRPSRLHDRICYELVDSVWQRSRLSP
ncbi:MAG TPA: pyridoxamine 5'-phosphate oxidase [Pyrinomonadaceae bacterium]|nr:pyridoxamine 5'-phosphate oxidase [Chloracidobacterium sp.]MBP9934132.1 pyridoxamine 5'-phosphate oxidase [Pyrinomonadaceae bacterium]MBK7801668.1 pyridoxamine 5'-phosphate oxidase [Chloracidobacterium sp.]MBK9436985.1 pyridoxamine 5'-phosphate oxidase [Chloracidobacterium sp.]MBL0241979.1 pyridoxamine 5'-phosphate oxidase [Chloracidobacterium sp.]